MLETREINCDLCVIGGGISGMCAAIAAARKGLSVVLMHERPVLGGNASSEIRMWISQARGSNNRATGIIEEIALENQYVNPTKSFAVWDSILYGFVHREKNIQLLMNCSCMDAETETGDFPHGRKIRIRSVTGWQMTTQRFMKVKAPYFCDCSGDSILAPLTGASFRLGRESADEFGELTSTKTADKKTMGMSCMVQGRETLQKVPYKAPEWAAKLTAKDFEHREPDIYNDAENFWYLELGGNRDSIGDTEELRDELVALAAGTWDYIKNSGNFKAENWDMEFLGFLPGKRESRRMCGEVTVTQKDISGGKIFEDEAAFGGWPLDDHFPDGFYHRGVPNTDYQTPAPYSIPYRCLYSANTDNLFFAGRNISVTHMALSSMRVMSTCALLGQAVGEAAALAVQHSCTPHDIYLSHLEELQENLMEADCFLPHKTRRISETCLEAVLTVISHDRDVPSCAISDDGGVPSCAFFAQQATSLPLKKCMTSNVPPIKKLHDKQRPSCTIEVLRNGQDRPHALYGTDINTACVHINTGCSIQYRFPKTKVHSIHLVFSSDLDRETLPGSTVERTQSTRSNFRFDQPLQIMPKTLCREFILTGSLNGEKRELLHVTDNHLRFFHLPVEQEFDELILTPVSSWGEGPVPVISFDFV